jgi:ABC-2 type transport system permease protein
MEQINWYGMYTLTMREVKRFLRVYNQTVIAPVVSALIFLAVFVLAIGGKHHEIEGIKFVNFMGYGLIIMSIVQNAFSNSSSSFIMSKVLGYISDILTPPLGSVEIIIALTIGSVIRGCMVGAAVALALAAFVDYNVYHPLLLIFFITVSCVFLGQLGILTGIITNNFDQNAAITSYFITPLSFLSGTFYSVNNLPESLKDINVLNPFFYIIDGFRYCLTNHIDGDVFFGAIYLVIANIALFLLLVKLLDIGWRVKG